MTPARCAVVFDWNGTLFDDTTLCAQATSLVATALGGNPVSVELMQKEYRLPLKDFYASLGCPPEKVETEHTIVFDDWSSHYNAHVENIPLRKGAEGLLDTIKERGHKSVILSNHTVENISDQTRRLCVHHYFEDILANSAHEYKDILHKAEKGARLKSFVETHDIQKAMVIGDSPEEIEIAHRYGFLGVGIAGGFCSAERIRTANPDFMIDELDELPAIIAHVFGEGSGR